MISHSTNQTQELAQMLGEEILKTPLRLGGALVLCLEGDLGSGKTTFIQGLAKGLKIKEKILSPTFIIMKKFQIPNTKSQTNSKFQISKFKTFYHIDCYRLKDENDIMELGLNEILNDPSNIIVIEWAERIKNILPFNRMRIKFGWVDKNKREIEVFN